jgi:hypothetical protein
MSREGSAGRQVGAVLLDIGADAGALVVHASRALLGLQIEVARRDGAGKRVHVDVLERAAGEHSVFAAVFPSLSSGDYEVWNNGQQPAGFVTVVAGTVAEVDWRER